MAQKLKFYVIWSGYKTGIFDNWPETEKNIKGYPNAQYKAFESKEAAFHASKKNYWASIGPKKTPASKGLKSDQSCILPSISVDAACAGNPGILEYQGVLTATKEVLFSRGPFPQGTVNLGEFLAIVHGLAYLKKNNSTLPLYSDSKTAIAWVRNKAIKTTLTRNEKNQELFQWVDQAIDWLKKNTIETKILKWETEIWGENPADYGRK